MKTFRESILELNPCSLRAIRKVINQTVLAIPDADLDATHRLQRFEDGVNEFADWQPYFVFEKNEIEGFVAYLEKEKE